MSTQKQPLIPKIGQRVFIQRKNSLGEILYFEGIVSRIRAEVRCKQGGFMTIASPHLLTTKVKDVVKGGNLL